MAPLIPAAMVARSAGASLKNDLATYRTSFVKGRGKKKITVEREIHVNPVSLAVGALAVAGTVVVSSVAWYGVNILGYQVIPGVRDAVTPHLPGNKAAAPPTGPLSPLDPVPKGAWLNPDGSVDWNTVLFGSKKVF